MPWIYAFFALILLGCSGAFSSPQTVGVGSAGAGGQTSQGGASAAAGEAGTGGTAVGASGGSGVTGGAAGSSGAPAGSIHVDVVPGVQTTCVFPTQLVLPPLTAIDCQDVHVGDVCVKCSGQCLLPFVFSGLSWDYSTLTLTMTVTTINNGLFSVNQGSCSVGTLSACSYQVFMSDPTILSVQRHIVFQKMDRGYVGVNADSGPSWGTSSQSCSHDTGAFDRMGCVQGSWSDYWYNVTIPCAK